MVDLAPQTPQTPPQTPPPAPAQATQPALMNKTTARGHNVGIILFSILLILGCMAYLGWRYLLPHAPVVYVETRPFAPSGTVFLTLTPNAGGGSGLYTFDVASKQLTKIQGKEGAVVLTMHAGGPQGVSALFASNIIPGTAGTSTSVQILGMKGDGSLTRLSTTETPYKRHPSYSEALGKIIYEGRIAENIGDPSPDASNVYVLVSSNEGHRITRGSMPALTPDGKSVVALRSDGLHLAPISLTASSTDGRLIWPIGEGQNIGANSQFSISPKGDYIAWSVPDTGVIRLMRVISWDPFVGELGKTIPDRAFWPVFSQDGTYLAYEAVDWPTSASSGGPSNARLVIFDLATPQKQVMQDLSGFVQTKMFISDWGK